jgi:hypothetical protein
VFNGFGEGCATPIQFELLMGVPKLVASQKNSFEQVLWHRPSFHDFY